MHSQHRVFSCTYGLMGNSSWGSNSSWGGPSGMSGKSMDASETTMVDGTSVDSWGSNVFVGVVNDRWSNDLLDDWFALDWGWDWNVIWPLNWDWFVNNEGFLANAGDWSVVGDGSQEGSWDSNVDVSNDWLDDSGVVCSDVWPVSIF